MSQEEAKTEFIEDIESTGSTESTESTVSLPGRLRKESSMNLIFIQGLDFFIEDSGLVYMSSQAPRKKDKIQLSIIRKLFCEAWRLGIEMSISSGLDITYYAGRLQRYH